MAETKKRAKRPSKVDELRRRLVEAEQVLQAIKGGHVDALVVSGPLGDQIYTLKDAARPYQVVVEEMNEGTLTMNDKGIILYANRRMAEMLGLSLEQVLGEPLDRFIFPAYRAAAAQLMASGLKDKGRGELYLSAADKTLVPIEISLKRVILDGSPRVSAIVSDRTERKRAEEKIQRYATDLEQRVDERTAQLNAANQKLEKLLAAEKSTRVQLEATNKELEAFAYTISHDMRGPLNQIEQLSRMVLDELGSGAPQSEQHLLQLIHGHAKATNCLAEDLLTLTRMSQQPLKKKDVSMADVVRQVVDELRATYAGRQVEITVAELPPASADPILVKQLWTNLISNALKFTARAAAARIDVGYLRSEGGTAYYVRDNGAGFDMAHADRLFRAFQRLHHEDDYEGNGLGLAIVDRVVRRHDGKVWAEAQVDHGATFYFTLGAT